MKHVWSIVVVLFLVCGVAVGQETRATLTGRVTDSTGAILPGAQIAVIQTDTGTQTNVVSNKAGEYTVPFLAAGPYKISVTSPGFQTYEHTGITLQVEQTVTENVKLAVGVSTQTVSVEADSALVDVATSSTGQVLTSEEVEDLPSNGRSPLGFAHLEYGAVAKGKHSESQTTPFGNSTADDFSLGGGASASNELLLNGVPNMQDGSRTAGFSPQLDSVDAVRVDEFAANAAMGDTSGGTVNITTKAGTNQLNGSLSEYYAGSRPLTAKPYFTTAGTQAPSTHFNQFGGTIGGPVHIPHVLHGRDKLFFFYAYEGYIGSAPSTTITSVPTAAERNGDFSALLAYNNKNQLYNPFTAMSVAGSNGSTTVSRSAIAGNNFANAGLVINPVAQAYLALIPLPNYNGASTKPDGENNFFASDPTTNNYKSNMARIDYNISDSNKIFFEAHRSTYVQSSANIFNNLLTGTNAQQILWGGQVDDVENFNPTLNLESRLGFSRYENTSNPSSIGKDPSSVGFPSYISSNSTELALPYLTFSDTAQIPSLSGNPGNVEYFDNIQFFASLNKTWGHHTIKIGPDIRLNKDSSLSPGAANGEYAFNSSAGDFVTSGTTGNAQAFGGALALFELGLPSTSSSSTCSCYAVNTKFQYDNWYIGAFAQDDWKISPNLTISMGLRIEHETPLVESNNRMVVGFNPTATNVATNAATAAYAAAPNALLPASAFSATGGLTYASSSNRSPYSTAAAYVSPRIGFAYSPDFSHQSLAIRGGFGIFVNPFGDYNAGPSYGYSQTTYLVNSTNNMLTPATDFSLSNPFPAGGNAVQQPVGSSFGGNTNLGSSIFFYAPVKVPYSEKWSLDVEKQFGKDWLVEVGYLGVHQVHNSYTNAISSAPLLPFLSRSPLIDPVVTKELGGSTANPFYGNIPSPLPSTSLNTSKTISVASLLQAYPEYSGVSESLVPGAGANFNAFLLKVSKRMSNGLQFNFNYEHSRQLGTSTQLNPGGPLWYGETTSDFPDHASFTGIYLLPIGKGRRFVNHSRVLDEFFGGYSVSAIYQFLSGTPLSWGNAIYTGNYSGFNNNPHDTHGASFNTSGFDTSASDQPNGYNYRTFPAYLLRSDPTKDFDFSVLKNFPIGDHIIIQPRVDAFNAFNRPQFSSANVSPTSAAFGDVTSQLNTGRQLQGGVHFLF
jgi:hypothetical protein